MAWLVQVRGVCAMTECVARVRLRPFGAARQIQGRVPFALRAHPLGGAGTLSGLDAPRPWLRLAFTRLRRYSGRFATSWPSPLRGHLRLRPPSAAPLRSGPPFGGLETQVAARRRGWGFAPPRPVGPRSRALPGLKCSAPRKGGRCALESLAAPPRPSPEGLGWLGWTPRPRLRRPPASPLRHFRFFPALSFGCGKKNTGAIWPVRCSEWGG
jgi:hypothetical protein